MISKLWQTRQFLVRCFVELSVFASMDLALATDDRRSFTPPSRRMPSHQHAREHRDRARSSGPSPSRFATSASKAHGWTKPRDRWQSQALMEAKAGHGRTIELSGGIKDRRFQSPGWEKVRVSVAHSSHIEVHYFRNRLTGQKADFKFKDQRRAGITASNP